MTNRLLFVSAALLLSASALFAADDYSTWFRYKENKVDIFGNAFYDPSDSTKTAVAAVSGQKYYIPSNMTYATIGSTATFKGDVLAVDSGSRLKCGSGGRVATFPELRLLPGGGFDYASNWHVAGKVVVCGTTANPSVATPFLFDTRIYELRANFLGEAGTVFRIAEQNGAGYAKGGVINRTSILASHPDISGNWEKFYGTIQVATNTYLSRSGTAQNISGKVQVLRGAYFASSLTSGTVTMGGLELQPATEMLFQFGSALTHPIYTITNSFAASGNFRITCTGSALAFDNYDVENLVLIRYTGTNANFSCDLSEAQVVFDTTNTRPQSAHLEWRDNAVLDCKELVIVPELPLVIGGLKVMTGWQEVFRLDKSYGTITEDDLVFPGYENVRGQCRYRVRIAEEDDEQVVSVDDLQPGTYNASSGYMIQTLADGNSGYIWFTASFGVGKGSTKTNYWADLKWPHSDTNYCSHSGNIRLQNSPVTFGGRSFTLSGYSRTDGEELIVDDMRVLPDSKLHNNNGSSRYKPGTTTSLGTFYHTTVRGNVAVFATTAKPFRLQSCIEAKLNGGGFEIFAALRGSSEAAIRAEEYANATTYGKRWHQVWIKGDTSKYYGRMDVGPNMNLDLCQDGFPEATVRLSTVYSALETMAPSGTVVTVATLDVPTAVAAAGVPPTNATVTVASTNVFAAGALSITGQLDKKGEGLFRAGGTATAGANACLAVSNGFIQATSENAFNGVKIAFGRGTGIAVDVGEDDLDVPHRGLVDTAIAEPFASESGTIAVSFRVAGDLGKNARNVAVCTVPAGSAFADKSKYVLAGKSRKLGNLSFVSFGAHGNSDGSITILAAFTADPGFAIFFK